MYENLEKQYLEHRLNMRSIPVGSTGWKLEKKRFSDFLQRVRDTEGQETVDRLCGYSEKEKQRKDNPLVVCMECKAEIGINNLTHHLKKRHGIILASHYK